MNLSGLFRQINKIFVKRQIPYAVIGGYAVAAWGEERATRDLDLLCAGDSRRLIEALHEEGMQFEHRIGDWDDPVSEVIRIDMGSTADPFEVDILIGIRNAPPDVLNRIRILTLEDVSIPVASPEDVILLKLLAGSARDLEDAKTIVEMQRHKLDLSLIRRYCPENLRPRLEELLTD